MVRLLSVMLALLALSACGGVRPAPAGSSPLPADRFLAVVDARGDGGGRPGQIHILDTVDRKLVRTLRNHAPDGVLLRGGSALLLGGRNGLERIDPTDWRTVESLKTAFHSWWKFLPEVTKYALSPDEGRLHLLVYHPDGPTAGGVGRLAVQSVDLANWQVLQPAVEVPPCSGRLLAPTPDRVYHVCLAGPLSVLDLKTGTELRRIDVGPVTYQGYVGYGGGGGRRDTFAGEFLRRDGRLVLVGATGVVKEVDPESGSVQELANLALPPGQMIPGRQAALSPDGKLLFVGTGSSQENCVPGCSVDQLIAASQADAVRVYDTATWQLVESFPTELPFRSLAVTGEGKELLLISTTERTVTFLDAETGAKRALIRGMGHFPSLIVGPTAPRL